MDITMQHGGKKISEGGYGCIYKPEIGCNDKQSTSKKYISKLQKLTFAAKNEIHIGRILKKYNAKTRRDILQYNFAPVISSCSVKVRDLSSKELKDCTIIKKNSTKKLALMRIRYINTDSMDDDNDFFIFMIRKRRPIEQTYKLALRSYIHLLSSIKILNGLNVVHFDLKGANIVYDVKREAPIIIDFGLSIKVSTLEKNLRKYFYIYAPQYYIWPLEVHYINLLINKSKNPTRKQLADLSKEYVIGNRALEGFSPEFKTNYMEMCYDVLKTYDGLTLGEKINKATSSWKTWDNYSLSIIFIKLIDYFSTNKGEFFITDFFTNTLKLLLLNIHPNPQKRLSIKSTQQKFFKLLRQ